MLAGCLMPKNVLGAWVRAVKLCPLRASVPTRGYNKVSCGTSPPHYGMTDYVNDQRNVINFSLPQLPIQQRTEGITADLTVLCKN